MTTDSDQAAAGLTLLFAEGHRPSAQEIAALAANSAVGPGGFAVSHRPDGEATWLELLASGLTFDLAGLAPGAPVPLPARRHVFGLDGPELPDSIEAIRLTPGPHVAGGGTLIPVVRVMTGIAARLSRLPGVRAVCWNPAGICIETALFGRIIESWLAGGVFPALGLTALTHGPDGGVHSDGLAFFTGQELWLEAGPEETPAETAKLAVRLIHHLVEEGGFHSVGELIAPDGSTLDAEPSRDGRVLRVWRRR